MAYGGYRCACCGTTEPEFLQLDHIDNNGGAQRRTPGQGSGTQLYAWLKRHNYPPGYQVLCANCNYAKANFGRCPHHPDKVVNAAVAEVYDKYNS